MRRGSRGECDALPGGDVKDMEGEKVVSVDIAGRRVRFSSLVVSD